MADRIHEVLASRLRLAAMVVVSAMAITLAGSAITPALAASGATPAATSGGNTDTSDTGASEGNTGTSDSNAGTPEEPAPTTSEPPAPAPVVTPPFLGKVTTEIQGQSGNAREGIGYQYEISVHNLGPGTLSGAKLRVMLPGRYFIEDVGDRDRKLRTVVRRENESGLPRHWRVWKLAPLAAGVEVKFTIHGHFAIRKRQSGNTLAATAAVLIGPTASRESDRDDVNVVRRRPNR